MTTKIVYIESLDMDVEVEITHCSGVQPYSGSAHNCPSDWDYYGYVELEYDIVTEDVEDSEEIYDAVLDAVISETEDYEPDYF